MWVRVLHLFLFSLYDTKCIFVCVVHICLRGICFFFVAFYYCFPSFPQSRSIFALFSNHRPDLRVQHSLLSLFPDWCVRTKKGWYERCVVVSCCAGIWISWTYRGMIYPCKNPESNNPACKRVLSAMGFSGRDSLVLSTQDFHLQVITREKYMGTTAHKFLSIMDNKKHTVAIQMAIEH